MHAHSFTAPRVEEDQLQREREELSNEARDQIRKELYGQDAPVDESEELIVQSLADMEIHLAAIADSEKEALLDAQKKCAEYIASREFRLLFLRAERFNAEVRKVHVKKYTNRALTDKNHGF